MSPAGIIVMQTDHLMADKAFRIERVKSPPSRRVYAQKNGARILVSVPHGCREWPRYYGMATIAEKPLFHVILSDRDQWAVEVEWPDSTLERINTFKDYSSALNWVNTQSETWLQVRSIFSGSASQSF